MTTAIESWELPTFWARRLARRQARPTRLYFTVKRAIDIGFVVLTMPVVAPVLLFCALAIKLDSPGPVLFRQQRTGRNGRRFQMYKFRTMIADAESRKQELMALNALSWPDFKIVNDPRITRIGRLLRKSSLDELPQLLNVLKGEMSLVGPRPTSFAASTYTVWQAQRLDVTPGITGLWQILARNQVEFDERSRLDIAYVENRSMKLDLLILVATVATMLRNPSGN